MEVVESGPVTARDVFCPWGSADASVRKREPDKIPGCFGSATVAELSYSVVQQRQEAQERDT